jgi:hypothetical protein
LFLVFVDGDTLIPFGKFRFFVVVVVVVVVVDAR